MKIDTSPGSLDGPPAEEKTTIVEYAGRGVAVILLILVVAFVGVGLAWIVAWMLTHFPGA